MQPSVIKEGVKYGIIAGIITLLITYGTWGMLSTESFVSAATIITFCPYIIILLIVTGLSLRKARGGVLSFADALKFAFLAYVIATLIEAIGTYVLYNWIDHDLTVKSFAIAKEKTVKFMEKIGAKEQDIDNAVKKMDKEGMDTGFKKVFLGYGLGLIWGFVKSLLIALVIRKEEKFSD